MFYTQPFRWKWVCSQHPMILISRDQTEPRALETVPPWGGGDVHGYCLKMFEMLKKVDETPGMKIDFDLSAKELLMFLAEIEDGKALMQKLLSEGRLGFVGGDYAQAHYHEARSESALRQIRKGLEVFRDELGVRIDTFQHQETGLFENLPQILAAFGVEKGAIHTFVSAFEFLEAPSLEILSNFGRLELVHGETFAAWRGLDGTCIPLYLPIVQNHLSHDGEVEAVFDRFRDDEDYQGLHPQPPAAHHKYPTAYEENRGLYHNGSIIVECPDLVSVTDAYIEDRRRVGDFWLMSEALDEELRRNARLPQIRYYTYWSYCEGQFGEKMFKAYRDCERRLLAAEAMQVMAKWLGARLDPFAADAAWDKLLTAQHHDVNWIDTQELKEWALAEMQTANRAADEYVENAVRAIAAHCGGEAEPCALVFNTLPVERRAVAALGIADGGGWRVFDGEEELPSQVVEGRLCFPADMAGFGYKSFRLERAGREAARAEALSGGYYFENEVLALDLLADGRLTSLRDAAGGERLAGYGNLLRGQLIEADGSWRLIGNDRAEARAEVTKGALCDVVSIAGRMDSLPYRLKIYLPHGRGRRIDFALEIDFNHTALGDYYHDESKLNLIWQTAYDAPEILIDEPFGAVAARAERPLHPANAVALSEKNAGLVYAHGGAPKCFVNGGDLHNVLAWGGKNFTNRSPWGWSGLNCFDMRLNGTAVYRYALSLTDDPRPEKVFAQVNCDIAPLVARRADRWAGARNLVRLEGEGFLPTAMEEKAEGAVLRAYDVSGRARKIALAGELVPKGRADVAGRPRSGDAVSPYEIFELIF